MFAVPASDQDSSTMSDQRSSLELCQIAITPETKPEETQELQHATGAVIFTLTSLWQFLSSLPRSCHLGDMSSAYCFTYCTAIYLLEPPCSLHWQTQGFGLGAAMPITRADDVHLDEMDKVIQRCQD